jgi:predicted lipoprotein with Yx(FWY)xxD motif
MKQHLGTGFAALVLAAALSGCGGSPGTTTTTPAAPGAPETTSSPGTTSASPGATSPATAAAADLKTATSSAGEIVVDAMGMSVYFFTKDVKDSGTSACTGSCITLWPPVITKAAKPAAEGVTGTLGTITTPEGAKQVTLNGLPLYYYAEDKNPGDILGQGYGNVWYLASPAGDMIKTMASSGY